MGGRSVWVGGRGGEMNSRDRTGVGGVRLYNTQHVVDVVLRLVGGRTESFVFKAVGDHIFMI